MTYPERMSILVMIGGIDMSHYLVPQSLTIESVLTRQADTANLTIEFIGNGSLAEYEAVQEWQEIIITDDGVRIFAGFVMTVSETENDIWRQKTIHCTDYTVLLDKINVKREYTATSDANIIKDLFSEYLPEIGTAHYISAAQSPDKMRFNRMTLREIMDYLAEISGSDWYVDYRKRLHYFELEETDAPFSLSSSPDFVTSFPYYNLTTTRDGTGVINRVEIVGGVYYSDDAEFFMPGTGKDNRIILPFRLHAADGESAVKIWRNDGTEDVPVWTAMDVLAGYIDQVTTTTQVAHYFQEKVIEQQAEWPNLPNAVRILAKYEVPLRTRVRSEESHEHYGRWFDSIVTDSNIVDKQVAKLVGQSVLAQSALVNPALSLTTEQPGLRSGLKVSLHNALRGIHDDYMIQRVTVAVGINGHAISNVQLGTYSPDLIDMMIKIVRSVKKRPEWNDEEVLDDLIIQEEAVKLKETRIAPDMSVSPYYWGDWPVNEMEWGFFAWDNSGVVKEKETVVLSGETIAVTTAQRPYFWGTTVVNQMEWSFFTWN